MSDNTEHPIENQNLITPAEVTSFENQETCIAVFIEPGKKAAYQDFQKLGGVNNNVCWFIPSNRSEQVKAICKKYNLTHFPQPIPSNFEELKQNIGPQLLEAQIEDTENSIRLYTTDLGIKWIIINDLLDEAILNELTKSHNGQKVKKLLDKHKYLSDQLTWFKNRIIDNNLQSHNSTVQQIVLPPPYALNSLYSDLDITINGLITGYTDLDNKIRIEPETITLIAGRPSHGKSTFMLNLLLNQINKYPDLHFYLFSYEETPKQIAIKTILNMSSFIFKGKEDQNFMQMQGYIKSRSDQHEMIKIAKLGFDKLAKEGRLSIIGNHYNVDDLCATIKLIKSQKPLGCVYVDYVQLIPNKNRFSSRQLELQNTSRQLLRCAQDNSVPIILGAQLGRDTLRANKVRLDNLRECGDLEQDANTILGLYNDSMNAVAMGEPPITDRVIKLEITPLKNRVGMVNTPVNLAFDRPILKIKNSNE